MKLKASTLKSISFLVFFFLKGQFSNSQNIFDKTHSLKYAEFLFSQNNKKACAIELERVLFNFGKDDSLINKLLNCYISFNDTSSVLRVLYNNYGNSLQWPASVHFFILPYLIQWNNELLIDSSLSFIQKISPCDFKKYKICYLLSVDPVKNFIKAKEMSDKQNCSDLSIYDNFFIPENGLKMKKPWVAASLSMIIPGAGKLYTGEYNDGIIGFAATSILAYQSYRGFSKRGSSSIYGFLYAGASLGFYVGGIYGAWKSALRSNNKRKAVFREQIHKKIRQ